MSRQWSVYQISLVSFVTVSMSSRLFSLLAGDQGGRASSEPVGEAVHRRQVLVPELHRRYVGRTSARVLYGGGKGLAMPYLPHCFESKNLNSSSG